MHSVLSLVQKETTILEKQSRGVAVSVEHALQLLKVRNAEVDIISSDDLTACSNPEG
jgi:hypothetical protein